MCVMSKKVLLIGRKHIFDYNYVKILTSTAFIAAKLN